MKIKEAGITIMVKDMDASIAFYQSIGVELQDRWENHYAQMKAPGLTIGLHPAGDKDYHGSGNVSIGFSIDSIDEFKMLLDGIGIHADFSQDGGGQLLTFKDPDGTLIYFIKSNW